MALLDQILSGVTSLATGGNNATRTTTDPNAGPGGLGGLGGLGQIGGALFGGGGKGQLLKVVLGMLASGKLGGLDGLLNKFKNNGMQNQLASWVGTQENQPVSATQVEQALGTDTIKEIADQAGMDQTEAAHGLAEVIPQLIDKTTPTGEVPQQEVLSDAFGKLSQMF